MVNVTNVSFDIGIREETHICFMDRGVPLLVYPSE